MEELLCLDEAGPVHIWSIARVLSFEGSWSDLGASSGPVEAWSMS
jgi:hypothetical protein